MKLKSALILVVATLTSGCFSPEPKSLSSDHPTSVIPAIKEASLRNDRTAIPRLIHFLDDPDSAIRFAAITALKRMTSQDFGFRYYDDEFDRKQAIDKWHRWLQEHPSP